MNLRMRAMLKREKQKTDNGAFYKQVKALKNDFYIFPIFDFFFSHSIAYALNILTKFFIQMIKSQ